MPPHQPPRHPQHSDPASPSRPYNVLTTRTPAIASWSSEHILRTLLYLITSSLEMEGIVPPYSSFSGLREAVRFGYIEDVRSKHCVIRTSEPTKPLFKFSRLLAEAIQHWHMDILEFLLLERIPINSDAVKAAAETRCHEALSMLFNHGWDINQPLSGDEPPVLR